MELIFADWFGTSKMMLLEKKSLFTSGIVGPLCCRGVSFIFENKIQLFWAIPHVFMLTLQMKNVFSTRCITNWWYTCTTVVYTHLMSHTEYNHDLLAFYHTFSKLYGCNQILKFFHIIIIQIIYSHLISLLFKLMSPIIHIHRSEIKHL